MTETLRAVSVDKSEDLESRAEDVAQYQQREDLADVNGGGQLKSFLKSIWQGQIAKGYYERKRKRNAREYILNNQNDFLHNRQTTVERFTSECDEVIHGGAGEWKDVLPEDHPAYREAHSLISQYASTVMSDEDFNEAMQRVKGLIYDNPINDSNTAKGALVVDNYLQVAQQARAMVDHGETIGTVMDGFEFIVGESRSLQRTEAHRSKLSELIDKYEHSKFGSVLPPEIIAGAASVAMWVGERTATTTAKALTFGLGGAAVVGVIAGAKEASRVDSDRANLARSLAVGDENSDNRYNQRMAETLYGFRTAQELLGGLANAMNSLNNEEILSALSEIEIRNQLSDQRGIDLIGYVGGQQEIERQRFNLDQARSIAKTFLCRNGVDNIDQVLSEGGSCFLEAFESESSAKDRAFRKLKRKRALLQGTKAGAMSLAIGSVAQEIGAVFEGDSYSLIGNELRGDQSNAHNTFLSGLLGMRSSETIINTEYIEPNIAHYDHELSDTQINDLEMAGFTVIDENYNNITPITEQVNIGEYIQNHQSDIGVNREFWYNNDTPSVFDKNELRAHYYTDADGGHGLITSMTDDGSYSNGRIAEFHKLAEEGRIKLFISATQDTQSTPFEVVGKLTDDGQLVFVPDPGSVAEAFFDDDGKFIGRYAEVAQVLSVDDNGIEHIAPLATAVGNGYDGLVTDTVDNTERVFSYDVIGFDQEVPVYIPIDTEIPPIVPIYNRRGLQNAPSLARGQLPELSPRESSYNRYSHEGSLYGYYTQSEDIFDLKEDLMPDLKNNSGVNLSFGKAIDYYSNLLKRRRGEEYVNRIDDVIESVPELTLLPKETRAVITIPVNAVGESENIARTLEGYVNQKRLDGNGGGRLGNSEYTVMLYVNYFDDAVADPKKQIKIDKTFKEIERVKAENPDMNIAVVRAENKRSDFLYPNGERKPVIGLIAKRMNDILLRTLNRNVEDGTISPDNDIIVIRNDADAVKISQNYIDSIISKFETYPDAEVVSGYTQFGREFQNDIPGLTFVDRIERLMNARRTIQMHNTHSSGANSAFRASTMAAVGSLGFNDEKTGAGQDDLAMGRRIETARNISIAIRDVSTVNPYFSQQSQTNSSQRRQVARFATTAFIETNSDRQRIQWAFNESIYDVWDEAKFSSGGYVERPAAMAYRDDLDSEDGFNETLLRVQKHINQLYKWDSEFVEKQLKKTLTDSGFSVDDYGLFGKKFRFSAEGREKLRAILRRIRNEK